MKRVHGLLLCVLGAAVVSCGGSTPGAGAGARVDQPAAGQSTAVPVMGTESTSSSSSSAAPAAPAIGAAAPGSGASQAGGAAAGPATGGSVAAGAPTSVPPVAPSAPAPAAPAGGSRPQAGGWSLTVTYTAVESFHHGAPEAVSGCDLNADECDNGTTPLGTYPSDFVDAVKAEGYGRITSGRNAGRYLAWDPQGGFSLETSASDASGTPLRAFVSAAADDSIPIGTHFTVQDCGVDATTHRPPDAGGCAKLTAAGWVVGGNTTQPWGSHRLNLYVGEETRPDFTTTVTYVIDTVNARTTLGY
jgi:hypothetical protein